MNAVKKKLNTFVAPKVINQQNVPDQPTAVKPPDQGFGINSTYSGDQGNNARGSNYTGDPMSVTFKKDAQGNVMSTPVDPMLTGNVNRPGYTYTDPMNPFSTTPAGVSDQYYKNLNAQMSGSWADPMIQGNREALARQEANNRAGLAQDIGKAGFSGTNIGKQAGSGLENTFGQNRLVTNINEQNAINEQKNLGQTEARAIASQGEQQRQFGEGMKLNAAQFGEGQYQSDIQQSNWTKSFNEDAARYKDTQEWQAFTQALAIGSDADVAKAYQAATGKTLDPMAISQYRQYARTQTEQNIANNQNTLALGGETVRTTLMDNAEMEVGNYLTRNGVQLREAIASGQTPEQIIAGDAELRSRLESMWKATGKTGPMDSTWAKQQIQSSLDNPIDQSISDIMGSDAFKSLPPKQQTLYGKFLQQMAVDGGAGMLFDMDLDDDGNLVVSVKEEVGSDDETNINIDDKDPVNKEKTKDLSQSVTDLAASELIASENIPVNGTTTKQFREDTGYTTGQKDPATGKVIPEDEAYLNWWNTEGFINSAPKATELSGKTGTEAKETYFPKGIPTYTKEQLLALGKVDGHKSKWPLSSVGAYAQENGKIVIINGNPYIVASGKNSGLVGNPGTYLIDSNGTAVSSMSPFYDANGKFIEDAYKE